MFRRNRATAHWFAALMTAVARNVELSVLFDDRELSADERGQALLPPAEPVRSYVNTAPDLSEDSDLATDEAPDQEPDPPPRV